MVEDLNLQQSYYEHEERKENKLNKWFTNVDKKLIAFFGLAIIFGAFYYLKDNPDATKIVLIILGAITLFVIIISGKGEKERDFINDDEAKAIVKKDLLTKKKGSSSEFNGLKGKIIITGCSGMREFNYELDKKYVAWTHDEGDIKTYYLVSLHPYNGKIFGYEEKNEPFKGERDVPDVELHIPFRYTKDKQFEEKFKK